MAAWLDLVKENGGWGLLNTGRLDELVDGMPYPKRQYPSLIYFAGNSSRVKALRALFTQNNVTRRGPTGLIRLHLSLHTSHTENPILFAESGLGAEHHVNDLKNLRYSAKTYPLVHIPNKDGHLSCASLLENIKRQHILPWCQILCLFLDSDSDIQSAQALLSIPCGRLAVGSEAVTNFMQVIVIRTRKQSANSNTESECPNFNIFADKKRFTILDLRQRSGLSDTVVFEPLRTLIFGQLQKVHGAETLACRRFSASHLRMLWTSMFQCDGWLRNESAFDLLAEARKGYPPTSSLDDCLREAASMASSSGFSKEDTEDFFASAFLMECYPPEMHGFAPIHVFPALYGKDRLQVWSNGLKIHYHGILTQFTNLFEQIHVRKSSQIRKDILGHTYRQWGGLHSTTVCYVCLCRPPEHMLPCQHALCDNCIVIFGNRSLSREYHFDLFECPICASRVEVTVRQLPPTKQPVILSLDGGGVRGIVQLKLLNALEKRIGLPIAFLPDLCIGTSVGALLAIDIFLNDTSIDECIQNFPGLAENIFYRPKILAPRWVQLIASAFNLTSGNLYDSKKLSETINRSICPSRRIFDPATTIRPGGCRVAIVASRISDGKACVLANYRGAGRCITDASYKFLMPGSNQENPLVRDIAVCSVAAPFYFQTKFLPGLGPLQDGGIRANNPLSIALRESGVIWPRARKHDLLLSVGTGFSACTTNHTAESRTRFWQGALPRLFRATMSSPCMDGKQGFLEALNYLPPQSKSCVYRLDQAMHDKLPELDDISSLQTLSMMDFAVPDELVRSTLASAMFFFELDEIPARSQAGLHCQGSILCSRPMGVNILQCVLREVPGASFQISRGSHLGTVNTADCCQSCGYFRKRVEFPVKSLQERFSIEIANDAYCDRIGGFPKTVQDLLYEQQAFADFGRADHQTLEWPPKRHCNCPREKKRKIQITEPSLEQRKRLRVNGNKPSGDRPGRWML